MLIDDKVLKIIRHCAQHGYVQLDLSCQGLNELPAELFELKQIEELRLYDNLLTNLPPQIGNLTELRKLFIYKNKLSSLPSEIGELKKLVILNATNNMLTRLPPTIGNLVSLRYLLLGDNTISALPKQIEELKNLEKLDLQRNALVVVPKVLGSFSPSTKIGLGGNPLIEIPEEVIADGDDAVLRYLADTKKGGRARYEAKLLLVGQGGVGKTCLSRALRDESYMSQMTTRGINVDRWAFAHPDYPRDPAKNMTLHIWDFEGQEISHSTHQFFLTERSLYLLVFNARFEAEAGRLEYWLETIRARAPQSYVIVVASQCDERTPSLDYPRLRARFGAKMLICPDYFRVSASTLEGIEALKEAIRRAASQLPVMGQIWPATWLKFEELIELKRERKVTYSTRSEFYQMMESAGIPRDARDSFARILGDLGTITHFPDSIYLQHLIVLYPQWLTRAVSLILDFAELNESGGELKHRWMKKVWRDYEVELHRFFHSCMEEFELCYPVEDDRAKSLVPLRFNPERPELALKPTNGQKLRISTYYFDFVPAGIMSRFIVKCHRYRPKLYWAHGIFISNRETQALCEFDPDRRTISISVCAAFPPNMMEQLCGNLQAVLETFKGLKWERKIGCIGFSGLMPCSGQFTYKQIVYAFKKSRQTIECPECEHEVDLGELISGCNLLSIHVEKSREIPEETVRRIVGQINSLRENINSRDIELVRQMSQNLQQSLSFNLLNRIDEREQRSCPTLVSISPVKGTAIDPRSWFDQRFQIRLYCQSEDGIHPEGGPYKFKKSLDWWVSIAPYLKGFVKILQAVAAPATAIVPEFYSRDSIELVRHDYEMAKAIVNVLKMPAVHNERTAIMSDPALGTPQELEGAALRSLMALLLELDPHRTWRGLRPITTPALRYLWVCEHHYKEYRRMTSIYD